MEYRIESIADKGKPYKHLTITQTQYDFVNHARGNYEEVKEKAWAKYWEHPIHSVFYQKRAKWFQDNREYVENIIKQTGFAPFIWEEDLLSNEEMKELKEAEAERDQKTSEAWEKVREARIALYGSDLCGMPLEQPLLIKVV